MKVLTEGGGCEDEVAYSLTFLEKCWHGVDAPKCQSPSSPSLSGFLYYFFLFFFKIYF